MEIKRFMLILVSAVLTLSSCFVKEDRGGCPCWMTVEMPDRVGHDGSVVLRLRGNSDEDAMDYTYKVSESEIVCHRGDAVDL